MDGRIITILLTMVLPLALFVVTGLYFRWNPLAVVSLFAVIVAGAFYLLSYTDSF